MQRSRKSGSITLRRQELSHPEAHAAEIHQAEPADSTKAGPAVIVTPRLKANYVLEPRSQQSGRVISNSKPMHLDDVDEISPPPRKRHAPQRKNNTTR